MKKETLYYAEGYSRPFLSEEACLKYEKQQEENIKRWKGNLPSSKLEKLKLDLDKAMYVSPSTIATCTHDSIAIKQLIRVCQKFAEENKEYLNHY